MWNIRFDDAGQPTIETWYEWLHDGTFVPSRPLGLPKSLLEIKVAKHLRKVLPEMIRHNGLRGLSLAELEAIRTVMSFHLPYVPDSL